MSLEVKLNYTPVVNFAMQQNHAPVIQEIRLFNNSEDCLEDITVSITFEPDFASPYSTHIERIAPGCEEVISPVLLSFSTVFLSCLTERLLGTFELTAACGEETLHTSRHEISILTFNEWGGIKVLPEILAAFSTPNHPEVTRIIKHASSILGEWTGSPSLDEYQTRDPNRVKYQMAALYKAISEEGITYGAIPPSFENEGQRIRLADEIVSTHLGNCIDMSMLYASCLEAMGLHPVVVISKGHAFPGCWLVGDSFPDSVNDDPSLITKRLADGINEMIVVEATCMNSGGEAHFDDACRFAAKRLDSGDFVLFVDIYRARIAQIRPLPLRVSSTQGWNLIEDEKTARRFEAPEDLSATDIIIDSKASVDKKTIWERKLLDLSLRNNLLNTRLTRDTIPIISVHIDELENAIAENQDFQVLAKPQDWDNEQISTGIYRAINATDPIYELVKMELSQRRLRAYLEEDRIRTALTHLYRSSRTAMEENGANTLYLALGLLRWFETPTSQKPRYAPILLVPIEIIRKSAASGYIIRGRDEETMLNITLLELLRQAFDITVGGLDPLPTDGSGVDVQLILNTFRRKIMSQRGWDVVEQAIIGNFSFNKFIMWNDIHNNTNALTKSKFVQSLMTGVADPEINQELGEEKDLDEKFAAGDIELPISADSSQLEAIDAALSGKSFILHGPPGTGKSQTITNIIANALYRGKRVLFVAEKMAALEVVQNRLESIGLGAFCLELHSNKAKKSNVIEQLKRTTEVTKKKPQEAYAEEAHHINEVRGEMTRYIGALHKTYPLGISLYDCIARYYSFSEETPACDFSVPAMKSLDARRVADAEVAISELKAAFTLIGDPAHHPLRGLSPTDYSEETERVMGSLSDLERDANDLVKLARIIQETAFGSRSLHLRREQYEALETISHILISLDNLYPSILALGKEHLLRTVDEICIHRKERDRLSSEVLAAYDESVLSINSTSLELLWRMALTKVFLIRPFAQKRVLNHLQAYSKTGSRPEKENVLPLLKSISRFQEEEKVISSLCSALPAGTLPTGNLDLDTLLRSVKEARDLNAALSALAPDQGTVTQMREMLYRKISEEKDTLLTRVGTTSNQYISTLQKLQRILDDSRRILGAEFTISGDWATEIASTASRWKNGKDKLRNWILFNRRKQTICDTGFGEVFTMAESGTVTSDMLLNSFHKGLYKTYAEYILTQENDLGLFHGLLFEEKISRYRGLCKDFESLTREELFARLASNLPALQREASQNSEVGILQRNLRNGCRGLSLRKFFDLIPDLLPRLCPCMLMSPISVAQYIDTRAPKFDLVIFDEASQMPTCEAVGAIARGKSIIVVGDPKQMPPTNFFSTTTFDEENAIIEDLESILDDCLALSLPSKYLRWHYRSKHESLIAFSNSKYYDNKLLTFPSPDDISTRIQYQYVKGVYERGGSRQNRAEAEAIVKEIQSRLRDSELQKKSIGVVTFNSNQQGLIEDLLTDLFAKYPDLEKTAMSGDEPIFIKNLENVQGDERDVILFSVGYGEDRDGKIALNFGPLNRDGGWRRLNVAVSRARYEMKVFSTLRSEQIDLKRTRAEGVAGLKAFLEYAEKGRDALKYNTVAASVHSDGFVEAVALALQQRGFDVRTNIGCSGYRVDIGVVHPENHQDFILGILCDGYNYSSSKSSRDREIVQIGILRKLGWKIARVWAMDWWNDREAVLDMLIKKIEQAVSGELIEEEEAPLRLYSGEATLDFNGMPRKDGILPLKDDEEMVNATTSSQEPFESDVYSVIPYEEADLDYAFIDADTLVSGSYNRIVMDMITTVIDAEAPIKRDLLCKRVLRALGIARMGPRISAYMDRFLLSGHYKTSEDPTLTFWKKDQNPNAYTVIRASNIRDAGDIPTREARNAALLVLEGQGAQPVDSLIREMAKVFGYSRVGDNVFAAMYEGIDLARKEHLLEEVDGKIRMKRKQ